MNGVTGPWQDRTHRRLIIHALDVGRAHAISPLRLFRLLRLCVRVAFNRRVLMTMPAFAEEIGSRLPSLDEREVANHLRRILAAQASQDAKLRVIDDTTNTPIEITLTPGISKLLMEMLRHIGKGDAVTLVPINQMLTTQQAADILNVSRPFLISLLERGEILHDLVGRHRRIKAENLFAYKRQRDTKRSKALADLGEIDGELI